MIRRAWILAVVAASVVASMGCGGAGGGSKSPSPPATQSPLLGSWIWVRDSDGSAPATDATISLQFLAPDQLSLFAFSPSEDLQDFGTWSTTATGNIALQLPAIAITVADKPFHIEGDVLTLPFLVMNTGDGTSQWRREASHPVGKDDYIRFAYDTYDKALIAGASDGAAADAAAGALIAAYVPPSGDLLESVVLNASKNMLTVIKEGKRVYLFLKTKGPKPDEFKNKPASQPLNEGFFFGDPRTHLYMTPDGGPNDPAVHSAALFFPFNTRPSFSARGGGRYTFRASGENPDVLRRQLARAGLQADQVNVAVDGNATATAIAQALLASPGVFYISTHGGLDSDGHAYVFATGSLVRTRPPDDDGRDMQLAAEAVNREIANGLPGFLANTLALSVVRSNRFEQSVYLGIGSDFFDALRAHGWTMSRSLVYLDACDSAASVPGATGPEAPRYFNAASFVGWTQEEDAHVQVRYSQHFFRQMVRKTHSSREIWDHIQRVLATRQKMYVEDQDLDDPDMTIRKGLAESASRFVAVGADLQPYSRLSDMVHWLVWLGRWNQDPATASANLQSCYDEFWKTGASGLGTSPMCQQGYIGNQTPQAADVKAARQLIHGDPTPLPPAGRWTLADGIPYLDPVGTPYD